MQFTDFEMGTFFVPADQKMEGFEYGIVELDAIQILEIVDCIDLLAQSFSIPHDMLTRIETTLLPRFDEIRDFLKESSDLLEIPAVLDLEITRLDRDDILYGQNTASITRELEERGYDVITIVGILDYMTFSRL
ncbi:MAG TPA: hypothetical protein VKM55_23295 [Candidatus Lokiarchaeia archaeon]|nr:hypothetical protein [Candidatus Lokiarchaeia archaeon]